MGEDLVPVTEYMALQPGANTMDLIRENLDGQEISEFDLARVKMPAGGGTAWSVPTLGGDEPRQVIEGVVVFFKQSRSYWAKEYDGSNDPPDCSSDDAKHATAREDVEIPASKDGRGFLLCDSCALSEWGSDPGGGRGQACKLTRQLFLLTPERMLPMVVSLPPTSLKPASQFFLTLADYNVDYKTVVTRIGLEKVSGQGVPDYSRATFQAGDRLGGDQAKLVSEYAAALRPHFDRFRVESAAEVGV